jgi:hypothetical protein
VWRQYGGFQCGGFQCGGFQCDGFQCGGFQCGGFQCGGFQCGGFQVASKAPHQDTANSAWVLRSADYGVKLVVTMPVIQLTPTRCGILPDVNSSAL